MCGDQSSGGKGSAQFNPPTFAALYKYYIIQHNEAVAVLFKNGEMKVRFIFFTKFRKGKLHYSCGIKVDLAFSGLSILFSDRTKG